MKKVLVIGGSGFIGLHFLQLLQEKSEFQPIVYDLKKPRYIQYSGNYVKGDVLDFEAVSRAVEGSDGIVDLAGVLGTSETFENIPKTAEVNILGALNVFEAARKLKKKVVYLSLTNNWLNPYTITKQAADRFAQMYSKELKVKIAILRGLNVYGEFQKYLGVKKIIPQFAVRALCGLPIEINGNGRQKVDLVDARDVAKAILLAVNNPRAYGRVFDIGTGRAIEVNKVAKLVIKLAQSKSKIVHKSNRRGEPENSITVADVSSAKTVLGFSASSDLENSLKRTIDWYKENLFLFVK
jgi:UDP-glucose 4-epimerase